jgi:ArsR family transcriptional regulator
MDTDELLEVLGNESRRKILSLLAKKTCYVSEIAYCLKMAPKVVLEHLEKLEKAGIIKSFEEGRRRYYYIDKSIRLEITITPHRFQTKLVENGEFEKDKALRMIYDVLSLDFRNLRFRTIAEINNLIERLEEVQNVFSRLQSFMNSKLNEMIEVLLKEVENLTSDEVEKAVLFGLAKGLKEVEIAEGFGLLYSEVENALKRLEERGLVERVVESGRVVWRIKR